MLFVNVSIGTPSQVIRTYLDTSSSDLWIPQGGADSVCSSSSGVVQTFDPGSSSTYKNLTTPFNFTASYANIYTVTGSYATDNVKIGGVTLPQQQFAIVNDQTGCTGGSFGIGFGANEGTTKKYENLPEYMAKQGLINTAAYSMWSNDAFGSTGEILFGGVDTEKYEGDLTTLPIIKQSGGYTQPILALTSVDINETIVDTNIAGEVILDTGSRATDIYLPEQMVEAIAKTLGGSMDADSNLPKVNCSAVVSNTSLGFTFTSTRIAVPLSHLIDGSSGGSPEDAGSQCTLSMYSDTAHDARLTVQTSHLSHKRYYDLRSSLLHERVCSLQPCKQSDWARSNAIQRVQIQYCGNHQWRQSR